MKTEVPFHPWSSVRIKTKLGGVVTLFAEEEVGVNCIAEWIPKMDSRTAILIVRSMV
jgi:hypothetical protein